MRLHREYVEFLGLQTPDCQTVTRCPTFRQFSPASAPTSLYLDLLLADSRRYCIIPLNTPLTTLDRPESELLSSAEGSEFDFVVEPDEESFVSADGAWTPGIALDDDEGSAALNICQCLGHWNRKPKMNCKGPTGAPATTFSANVWALFTLSSPLFFFSVAFSSLDRRGLF